MAKKNSKITVIVPLHDLSDKGLDMLNKAISSVDENAKIIISCIDGTDIESIGKFETKCDVTLVAKSEGTSFQELVNAAVEAVTTDWFSVLEYDDTYSKIWYDNALKYIDFKSDVSVLMFFEDIFNINTGKYLGMGNESTWASSFSEEIGYLDNQALMNYFDYYMTGCLFKTDDWKEIGGLKPHIKVTFWYEWLLRATSQGKKIFTIPKIGYVHQMGRSGSLTDIYQQTLSDKEVQWWFDLAKRDFHYKGEKDAEYYIYKEKNEDDDSE